MLNDGHRRQLLSLARTTIESAFDGCFDVPEPAQVDEALDRPAGAFVTLRTRDGDLRGCIGSIHPREALYRAVVSGALSAAFRDPRFPPVEREELSHLHIEISVMGPIERVTRADDVVIGRDGLIVSRGRSAGLLLPQVATEYGWDCQTFLDQTCVKAGLRPGLWRDPATVIEKFSAEVFGE
ncbi:MAG: AmmeMemoRadiSam system protein A [Acidobacteriota bacterium]